MEQANSGSPLQSPNFTCSLCGTGIRGSRFHLTRHLISCRRRQERRTEGDPSPHRGLLCHICGEIMGPKRSNLDRHVRLKHSASPTPNTPVPQSSCLPSTSRDSQSWGGNPNTPVPHNSCLPSTSRDSQRGGGDTKDKTEIIPWEDRPVHPELIDLPDSFWLPWDELQPTPTRNDIDWEQDSEIEDGSDLLPKDAPEDLKALIKKHWEAIRTRVKPGVIQSVYNYRHRLDGVKWEDVIKDIFRLQKTSFKLNCSHSYILANKLTGELRFFHSSSNNARVFDSPRLIRNRVDLESFVGDFLETDFLDYSLKNRADTQWKVHSVLATTFYVYALFDHPIGCLNGASLPNHIKSNKYILSLTACTKTGRPYKDNMCFFRALAYNESDLNAETRTKAAFVKWCQKNNLDVDTNTFSGITLEDLEVAEKLFETEINVYQFQNDAVPSPLLRTLGSDSEYNKVLNLLLIGRHFCLIVDVGRCARSFQCEACDRVFRLSFNCERHRKICRGLSTRFLYPGSYYKPKNTLKDLLLQNDIPLADETFPYRACYDFEVFFSDSDIPDKTGDSTNIICNHIPASVSVCSNIPHYNKPKCFVSDGDPQELVDRFVDYLEELSAASYKLLKERNVEAYGKIEQMEKDRRTNMTRDEDVDEDDNENIDRENPINLLCPDTLEEILDEYLMQLPVVSFNGGKYDLNVIKPWLFRRMLRGGHGDDQSDKDKAGCSKPRKRGGDRTEEELETRGTNDEGVGHVDKAGCSKPRKRGGDRTEEELETRETNDEGVGHIKDCFTFIAKRGNQYLCLATPTLKFLDMVNYLAPGISYDSYLKAFEVEQRKFFFPYEWFTSLDKLKQTSLPSREDFRSSLRGGQTISEEDYTKCQKAWVDNGMSTMLDYLIYYNNLDVVPFLSAIKKQAKFYSNLGLDLFKDGISVSGLTLKYLFSTLPSDIRFSICNEKNKDLLNLCRASLSNIPQAISNVIRSWFFSLTIRQKCLYCEG